MHNIREVMEKHQITIYFISIVFAIFIAWLLPDTSMIEVGINPALALMLLVTFLQVPLVELGKALSYGRF